MSGPSSSSIFGLLQGTQGAVQGVAGLAGALKNTEEVDAQAQILEYENQLTKAQDDALAKLKTPSATNTADKWPDAWKSGLMPDGATSLNAEGQSPEDILAKVTNRFAQKELRARMDARSEQIRSNLVGEGAAFTNQKFIVANDQQIKDVQADLTKTAQEKADAISSLVEGFAGHMDPTKIADYAESKASILAYDALHNAGLAAVKAADAQGGALLSDKIEAMKAAVGGEQEFTFGGKVVPLTTELRDQVKASLERDIKDKYEIDKAMRTDEIQSFTDTFHSKLIDPAWDTVGGKDEKDASGNMVHTPGLVAIKRAFEGLNPIDPIASALAKQIEDFRAKYGDEAHRIVENLDGQIDSLNRPKSGGESIKTKESDDCKSVLFNLYASGASMETIEQRARAFYDPNTVDAANEAVSKIGEFFKSGYGRDIEVQTAIGAINTSKGTAAEKQADTDLFLAGLSHGLDGRALSAKEKSDYCKTITQPKIEANLVEWIANTHTPLYSFFGGNENRARVLERLGKGKADDIIKAENSYDAQIHDAIAAMPQFRGVALTPHEGDSAEVYYTTPDGTTLRAGLDANGRPNLTSYAPGGKAGKDLGILPIDKTPAQVDVGIADTSKKAKVEAGATFGKTLTANIASAPLEKHAAVIQAGVNSLVEKINKGEISLDDAKPDSLIRALVVAKMNPGLSVAELKEKLRGIDVKGQSIYARNANLWDDELVARAKADSAKGIKK